MKMTPFDAMQRLAQLPVATVYEAAGKLGDVAPHIRPLIDGVKLAGPAFTLKTMPGDTWRCSRQSTRRRPAAGS